MNERWNVLLGAYYYSFNDPDDAMDFARLAIKSKIVDYKTAPDNSAVWYYAQRRPNPHITAAIEPIFNSEQWADDKIKEMEEEALTDVYKAVDEENKTTKVA